MKIFTFKLPQIFLTVAAFGLIFSAVSCSEDVVAPEKPGDNYIPGQEVGIKELKVSLPRLKRFDGVADHFSCRLHLRGRTDHVTYPIRTYLSADEDSLYIEADDPILTELPHQMYHLNAVTFPRKPMTTREGEEETVVEDTVYVGARLSIVNPDQIGFRSSFNVEANSIGSGTEDDPWIIASGDDFMLRISDPMTRGETHEGKFFEITRNLNLNTAAVAYGKGWEPAGHNTVNGGSASFNGTIDGCDNYIENLYCLTDAGYGGLFYSLGGKAYIHNLEMKRVMLKGKNYIGAFACYASKGCRLDSVQVDGNIEGNGYLGGLIGKGDADVKVCISSVDITSDSDAVCSYAGGMIGKTEASSFTDCIRTGRIELPNFKMVGGYVGGGTDNSSSDKTVKMTRCYVSGNVTGKEEVGGFIGLGNADFTTCHAAATLPQNSYAYTTAWDIFGLNNQMTPLPLQVEGSGDYVGGFVGSSANMKLQGENSYAYRSPATPNIVGGNYTGALAGYCVYNGDSSSKFTSYAYTTGRNRTGGIVGSGVFHDSGTFVNYGNVIGREFTGGVIGMAELAFSNPFTVNCRNTGNVQGSTNVGGVIGSVSDKVSQAVLENDGNVEGSGNNVGGIFGSCSVLDLAEGSHVSSSAGSLKISGKSNVGGLAGKIENDRNGESLAPSYCPVYANIISSGGNAGGLFGYVNIRNNTREPSYKLFNKHYPVRVSVTVTGGDNVGGVIGHFNTQDGTEAQISGFGDMLQASITSTGNIVGGIVGRLVQGKNHVFVKNCHSFATITSTAGGPVSNLGGIVGMCENKSNNSKIEISTCSFHGSLSGSNIAAAGGIVGYADDRLNVSYCYNAGRIDAAQAAGGIMGRIVGGGSIGRCFNMGEVVAGSGRTWVAGILGQKEDGNSSNISLDQCYNVGKTGWGIIGGEDQGCSFTCRNCFYLNTASNGDMQSSGAQSRTADEMRRQSTFNGWNDSNWEFHEGSAAPTLRNVQMFGGLPLQK